MKLVGKGSRRKKGFNGTGCQSLFAFQASFKRKVTRSFSGIMGVRAVAPRYFTVAIKQLYPRGPEVFERFPSAFSSKDLSMQIKMKIPLALFNNVSCRDRNL